MSNAIVDTTRSNVMISVVIPGIPGLITRTNALIVQGLNAAPVRVRAATNCVNSKNQKNCVATNPNAVMKANAMVSERCVRLLSINQIIQRNAMKGQEYALEVNVLGPFV